MIYKYIGTSSPEESIKILEYFVNDGSIMASNPRTFNDPSEFKVKYNFEADKGIIQERFFVDNPSKSIHDFESWYNSFNENSKWYIGYETRKNLLHSTGVVCFTTESENYLMWSHYAKSHTGFCIGFDDEILDTIESYQAKGPVEYSNEVPEFKYYSQTVEDFYKVVFFNKSTSWAYEKEFRVVTDRCGIKKFNKSLIKEIIIGCKSPVELDQFVRQYINTEIAVYHMIDLPSAYQLKKERMKHGHYVERCSF
ncbi:DUF2971 domain-containing protein [Shewanella sp. PP-He15 brown]